MSKISDTMLFGMPTLFLFNHCMQMLANWFLIASLEKHTWENQSKQAQLCLLFLTPFV